MPDILPMVWELEDNTVDMHTVTYPSIFEGEKKYILYSPFLAQ